MGLILGTVVFLLIIWWLYKKEILEDQHVGVVIVLAGFALAGYLGVSQY